MKQNPVQCPKKDALETCSSYCIKRVFFKQFRRAVIFKENTYGKSDGILGIVTTENEKERLCTTKERLVNTEDTTECKAED